MTKKWQVESKYTTKAEYYKFYEEQGENPEDYDIDEFNEVEISVVREDNEHGIKSYGWPDLDKIILFDSGDYSEKDIEWCERVAKAVCNTLNKEEL